MDRDGERLDADPTSGEGRGNANERIGPSLQRFRLRRPVLVRRPVLEVPRAGFTLLEAMVALTLSSIIVALVSTVFLSQNNFYRTVLQRTRVQDNLRVVTDFIASEVRGVAGGGVTTAESRRFVVRLPIAMAGSCAPSSSDGYFYMPGLSEISGSEVAGYGTQDASGDWTYTSDTWSNLLIESGLASAEQCILASGADTVGAMADFGKLLVPNTNVGDVIMVYRQVEFKIQESELEPMTLAVYRAVSGDALREFATGITPDAKFQYRLPAGTYQNSVSSGSVADIENIRVVASAIATDSTGTLNSYSYEWTVGIPLRNKN